MRFPCPMVLHKFNNDYDVILWAVSALLDRFNKEDKLFAAQCIWWLASIIQFTEILSYYQGIIQFTEILSYYQVYKIFPSDYVEDLVLTLNKYLSDNCLH